MSPGPAAILLAAGESTRMGEQKALLDWHGATLLEFQLSQLAEVDDISEIIVVTGHEPAGVKAIVGQSPRTWEPLREVCASVEVLPLPRPAAYARTALRSWRDEPLTLSYFGSQRMRRAVEQHAARDNISAVVAFSTAMAPYALPLQPLRGADMVTRFREVGE